MREAGATTPILRVSLLIQAARVRCDSPAALIVFADVPVWRLLFLRHRR
jgi:hypothetical protein